jgi:curved DNA-binding protein CbpA
MGDRGAMKNGPTLYEIVGVQPSASVVTIRRECEVKMNLLSPQRLADADSNVVMAASRTRQILSDAWEVLGNADLRRRYDEEIGVLGRGWGLNRPETDVTFADRVPDMSFGSLTGLDELFDRLGPGHPPKARKVAMPDVRGLFVKQARDVLLRLGFKVREVKLTEHPMAVPGLVVGQSPDPAMKVRRGREVTVTLWFPRQEPQD